VLVTQRWLSLRQEICNLGVLFDSLNLLLEMPLEVLLRQQPVILCGIHTSISPFPWPLHQDKLWVETTTAFHQYLLIIRSFTLHELGQIIDLRSDWSTALVQIVWKWYDGALPPLRLLAEIGIIEGVWGVWLLSQQ
jgi:hypothetical protein